MTDKDTPKGLDVIPAVPGTIVGSHDVQGTDGETRTDRPGELLGSVALGSESTKRNESNREKEAAKHDYVASEVDRANREELPKLGGDIDDGWTAGKPAGIKTIGTK